MNLFGLNNIVLCYAVVSATSELRINSEWLQFLDKYTIHEANRIFDLISSVSFLTNVKDTALYSPMGADINLLTQMSLGEFGADYVEQGKRRLEVEGQLVLKQAPKFSMVNNVYLPVTTKLTKTSFDPMYLLEEYKHVDASSAFMKHQKCIQEKTEFKLTSPLSIDSFENGERIYSSVVSFKDTWLNAFDFESTKSDKFVLRDGSEVTRDFMTSNHYFKYRHVTNDICDFEMVVIPYEDRILDMCAKRNIIYLIPKDPSVRSEVLFESFFGSDDGPCFSNLISKAKLTKLQLSIPKVEIHYDMDLSGIMSDLYEEHVSYNVSSKMKMFFKVDEEGKNSNSSVDNCCTDEKDSSQSIIVKANVPYIAIVYDESIARTLFVLKDEGTKLK